MGPISARSYGAGTPFELWLTNGHGRAPYASMTVGAFGARASPDGVALARFGWLDSDGLAWSTQQASDSRVGFVLPVATIYPAQRLYRQGCSTWAQPGTEIVMAAAGDFCTRFPNGAAAGARVYVDPATGLPYTENPGTYVATSWTTAKACAPGCSTRISSSLSPFL